MVFDPAQHQGVAELCHSQGKERVEAEPGHRAGLQDPECPLWRWVWCDPRGSLDP